MLNTGWPVFATISGERLHLHRRADSAAGRLCLTSFMGQSIRLEGEGGVCAEAVYADNSDIGRHRPFNGKKAD